MNPIVEEIKQIKKELAELKSKKDDKEESGSDRKHSKKMKKIKEEIALLDQKAKKDIEDIRKMNKYLQRTIGGIENSAGKVVEEYFANSLKEKMEVNNVKYDIFQKNVFRSKGRLKEELDICLINHNQILIVEVKKKLRESDIEKVERKIKNFPKLFPEFKGYKLKGALASFHMEDELRDKIVESDMIAMQRAGKVLVTSC